MANKYSSHENAFLKSAGANISRFRKKISLSQEELADLAGVDRSYLGSVERGERNISLLNIVKLANALGVKPKNLMP